MLKRNRCIETTVVVDMLRAARRRTSWIVREDISSLKQIRRHRSDDEIQQQVHNDVQSQPPTQTPSVAMWLKAIRMLLSPSVAPPRSQSRSRPASSPSMWRFPSRRRTRTTPGAPRRSLGLCVSNARQLHSNSELVQVLFVEHLGIQDKLVQKEKKAAQK